MLDTEAPLIRRNRFHRNTHMEDKIVVRGLLTEQAGHGAIICGNTFTGGFEDAIGTSPEDPDGHTDNMDVHDNVIDGACNDDGIQVEGPNVNVRIWNNEIRNCFMSLAFAPNLQGPTYVFRNVAYDNAHLRRGPAAGVKLGDRSYGPLYFYHNTFYANAAANGLQQTNDNLGNLISKNNIYRAGRYVFELNGTLDPDWPNDFDYDAMFTTDSDRFVKWAGDRLNDLAELQDLGHEPNGLVIDAADELVNPGEDFSLKSGSTLIDRGVSIPGFNDNPLGDGPDIGAVETE